ncbi:type IV secretory system conjugative DNA transfer family protein [Peribacillus loiseleuriae]|uniref:type IV secretory system conjugative DNA transfer family protein n=1 Tax=Peribacillus loiseleuriae TaxID=1679170 RepID=UPI003D0250BD
MDGISKFKNFWLKQGDNIEEWVRLRFHTYFVTFLSFFNFGFIGLSALSVWLGLSLEIPYFSIFPFLSMSWITFLILLNLPLLTWFYTTITFPIKKGHKTLIDWSSTNKGRILALFLNGTSLNFMLWLGFSRYSKENYVSHLSSVQVSPRQYDYLMITNMNPFITLIYILPLLITLFLIVYGYRHYMMNQKILQEQFLKWEPKILSRYSHPLKYNECDVIIGFDKENKKPLVLKENERYLHELVSGATGSGKTSTSLLIRIVQDLVRFAKGKKMAVVLLEPKGDAVNDVLKLARKLGVPEEKIYVVDPTKSGTVKFNPFTGPLTAAADSFRGTLNALTGDQDEFFKGQQEETAGAFTLLAKMYYGELTNITHLQQMYTDSRYLANLTEGVRAEINKKRENDSDLSPEDIKTLDIYERVVRYFEDEVLDYKTYRDKDNILPLLYAPGHRYEGKQVVDNKKDKYVSGGKKYLNDIAMNAMLSDLMVAKDNDQILNLDKFLDEGGVLLVNTALGELEELSLMFGQFFIRQFQSAVFRRPKEEDGYVRAPVFFNIDEFPLYINQSFERFLTLGRSYKVGTLIALQSLGQLESVVKGYRETIMTNASTKTVFGRGSYQDNKIFSETFGEDESVDESMNESTTPVTVENPSWGLRHNTQKQLKPRFTPTDVLELPFKHMIIQMVKEDGSISTPKKAYGQFVSEARFLKKYFALAQLNLTSEKNQEIDINAIVDSDKFTQDFIEKNVSDNSDSKAEEQQLQFKKQTDAFSSNENADYNSIIAEIESSGSGDISFLIPDSNDEQISMNILPTPENKIVSISKKRTANQKKNDAIEIEIKDYDVNSFIDPVPFEQLDFLEVIQNIEKMNDSESLFSGDPPEIYSIPDEESLENVNDMLMSIQQSEEYPLLSQVYQEEYDKAEPSKVLANRVTEITDEVEDDI